MQPAQRHRAAAHHRAVARAAAARVLPDEPRRLRCVRALRLAHLARGGFAVARPAAQRAARGRAAVALEDGAGEVAHAGAVALAPRPEASHQVGDIEPGALDARLGEQDRLREVVVVGVALAGGDLRHAAGVLARDHGAAGALIRDAEQVPRPDAGHHPPRALTQVHSFHPNRIRAHPGRMVAARPRCVPSPRRRSTPSHPWPRRRCAEREPVGASAHDRHRFARAAPQRPPQTSQAVCRIRAASARLGARRRCGRGRTRS